jgi:hypothetical protein
MRTAMAAASRPGTDPDRLSFNIAWHAARDQVTSAADVIAADTADLAGTIGRQALAALLPARRQRVTPGSSSERSPSTKPEAIPTAPATKPRSAPAS